MKDFGYMWYARAFLVDGAAPPPQKVVTMPECAHFLDPVVVPGPSAQRSAPTVGCLRYGPPTRDARESRVWAGSNRKLAEASIRLVRKAGVEDWMPKTPAKNHKHKNFWSELDYARDAQQKPGNSV